METTELPVIIIADSDAAECQTISDLLKNEFNVIIANDGQKTLTHLMQERVTVIVAESELPGMHVDALVAAMRERDQLSRVPVVTIIADGSPAAEKAAMDAGVADFVIRPFEPTVLRRRIHNVIARAENEWRKLVQEAHDRELITMQDCIEHDTLTGLYNRETFYRKAAEIMKANTGLKYQIIYFDISCFKIINDLFHADTGNLILKNAAYYFQAFCGTNGVCGRIEADHFVLCLPEDAIAIDALIAGLDSTMESLGINYRIVFSAGIYPVTNAFLPVDQMCDRANMALKKIKGHTIERYAYYDDGMRDLMLQEQMIVRDMELSLHEKQFVIYLQPVVNIKERRIVSAEALVRWEHPIRGMIPPTQFVPIFERNGFIVRLDRYVWEEVCRLLRQQIDTVGRAVPISVNISRLNFYNYDLLEFLLSLLKKYNLTPDLLKLEITERAYNDNKAEVTRLVADFRRHGFLILMDDFGSGFSSLSMLKNMPMDMLKIDMGFIREIGRSTRADAILKFIMGLSQELNMKVVVEGVETEAQADILEQLGCEDIQGFYFSRPMPSDEFIALLKEKGEIALP